MKKDILNMRIGRDGGIIIWNNNVEPMRFDCMSAVVNFCKENNMDVCVDQIQEEL